MIISAILDFVISVLNAGVSWLPSVSELPFGIDTLLVQGFGYIHFIMGVFPPLDYVYTALINYWIFFLIPFKVLLLFPRIRNMFNHN